MNKVLSSLDSNLQKNIDLPFANATLELKMENEIQFNSEYFELDLLLDVSSKNPIFSCWRLSGLGNPILRQSRVGKIA